jgi:hypothetical protein
LSIVILDLFPAKRGTSLPRFIGCGIGVFGRDEFQPGVLGVLFQQALALQAATYTLTDQLNRFNQLILGWSFDTLEPRGSTVAINVDAIQKQERRRYGGGPGLGHFDGANGIGSAQDDVYQSAFQFFIGAFAIFTRDGFISVSPVTRGDERFHLLQTLLDTCIHVFTYFAFL